MSAHAQNRGRYRAKAARRPLLFWWQAFFLIGVVATLWSQLPVTAVLFESRPVPPQHGPRAAYVLLGDADAAQAFKRSLTAWTLGGTRNGQPSGLELGGVELGDAIPAPRYLEQGMRYPGEWRPSAVTPLPQKLPEVRPPSVAAVPESAPALEAPSGVRLTLSGELKAAAFTCPVGEDQPPERSGRCRFYVETGRDGWVEHVLLLTARSLGAAVFERTLLKGRTTGPVRGFVDVDWYFPK
jgi:hypothetical protein